MGTTFPTGTDIMARVTSVPAAQPATAPAHPTTPAVDLSRPPSTGPVTRPDLVSVGTIVWLSSELMFFAGLFAMFFTIRSQAPELWADRSEMLNVPFAAANTFLLVLSSVWCQLGVWKAEKLQPYRTGSLLQVGSWGMREWYVLTYIFGAIFVSGQVFEYATLISEGLTLSSDGYGSIFYLTTGLHAIHVSGGLIFFLLIIGRTFTSRRYGHHQASGAIAASYYWHFVDVVWIGLFFCIYILK